MTSPPPAMGFADPVFDSQGVFRTIMNAMARPGHIQSLHGAPQAPAPLGPVAGAITLTLLDQDTPIWIDQDLAKSSAVGGWISFHCGAPITTDIAMAHFALAANPLALPCFSEFAIGNDRYPDRSATLILQADAIYASGQRLAGPGIDGSVSLGFEPFPENFWNEFARNHTLFPRGVDVILAGPRCVAALPRSTRVQAEDD